MSTKIDIRNQSHYFEDSSKLPLIPPWCSGKVHRVRKRNKVTSAASGIRSSYPLRINIWEYLHDSNENFHGTSKSASNQTVELGKNNANVRLFLAIAGILLVLPLMPELIFKADEIRSAISETGLITLPEPEPKLTQKECCDKAKFLARELLRVQDTFRQTKRLRWNMMYTRAHVNGNNISNSCNNEQLIYEIFDISDNIFVENYLSGAIVYKGANTREWGGQLSLWGVIPLWRSAPPPDIVLALRKPIPADCWPLSGSTGELIMEFPHRARVQHASVEHVRPDTQESAPRRFTLHGVLENGTSVTTANAEYTNKGRAKQYYPLRHAELLVKRVIFRVLSNHGNSKYTCIYRVHIYGVYDT